ncbi:cation diffusion facilitator family transporter [Pseudaquabacterium pictum]|uniref:Cobalt transporter n=1 Tax=Pseudaquabacterium pictum TaxID=2315236 RepID=A0A480AS30_9BURK|nr:cation diffusion facilitator family transporter [Rubrivivax pictus]GCL64233.1 cobalt transporter [Rubrivivax pictus]
MPSHPHDDHHGHADGHGHDHADPAAHGHAHGHSHGHAHGHGHTHAHAPANFDRAFALGIGLNIAFVAVEAFYGWRVNSLALLADAGHNLSDVAGLVLAWAAAVAGRRQADARHTYGWQRASLLAALANALLLLVAMGSLGWEAVQRLGTPQPTQGWTLIAVAGVGIVVNGATALLFLRGSHGDINLRGAFLHMASDALVSLGVVLGGALVLWQGWTWVDPVISLLIAVVIVVGTWGLLRQSVHLLFDGVPDGIDLAAVRRSLLALPGVVGLHDLHVWAMGSTENAATAHLVLTDQADAAAVLQAATQALRADYGIGHATLQLETPAFAAGCAVRHGESHG